MKTLQFQQPLHLFVAEKLEADSDLTEATKIAGLTADDLIDLVERN